VITVSYLHNDSKYAIAFTRTSVLNFRFCCVVAKVIISVTYKAESKFENEPNMFFKAVSLDHRRVSPIVESFSIFVLFSLFSDIHTKQIHFFLSFVHKQNLTKFFNFRDSVMALNNCMFHNVFRTIAYTIIRNELTLIFFFDKSILKSLMSLMSLITYRIRYRCQYLLTGLAR
jgi:hypothetical protein